MAGTLANEAHTFANPPSDIIEVDAGRHSALPKLLAALKTYKPIALPYTRPDHVKLLALLAIKLAHNTDYDTRNTAEAARHYLDGLTKRLDTGNVGVAMTQAEATVIDNSYMAWQVYIVDMLDVLRSV